MKRVLLMSAAMLAVTLAARSLATMGGSAQPSGERITMPEPPNCATSVALLNLSGEEVHCQEPPVAADQTVRLPGPYRLLPAGFRGPLDYADTRPASPPSGPVATDIASARQSSLFTEPKYLPDGYRVAAADSAGQDSEFVIRMTLEGPGAPIEVVRIRRYERPIDVILSMPDMQSVTEPGYVGTHEAILTYPKPGAPLAAILTTSVRFVSGGEETIVQGDQLSLETALAIAESMA
mgnify:CR=1 FL=1